MFFRMMSRCLLVGLSFFITQVALAETLVALTTNNALLTFDSASPGAIIQSSPISGLALDEDMIGIDSRPADGLLYGLTTDNNLYRLDAATGLATLVGTLLSPLAGASFGVDFNPTVDRIRLVGDTNDNYRIVPATGAVLVDTSVSYQTGDPNFGADPSIAGAAYTNNFAGGGTTALYCIDATLDVLTIAPSPNSGLLQTIGLLGFNASSITGFDISQEGEAYAALDIAGLGISSLFTVNLDTGAATLIGPIGLGFAVIGLAGIELGFSPDENEPMVGLTTDNQLVRFGGATPGTLDSTTPITGLAGGESLLGIDYRPATLDLYGISNLNNVYTIDANTGAATLVATTDVAVNGNAYGVDFNPVPDRLRVVSDLTQNLRINPLTAAVLTDGALNYAVGDINELVVPTVVAAAYTNSIFGASITALYDIDSGINSLVQQNPPNDGDLITIGTLGVDTGNEAGFDISGRSSVAYAALSTQLDGTSVFYTVDLDTGKVRMVGIVGNVTPLRGLAVGTGWASADQDQDNTISLSELLRAIQFFSSGGLYCADAPTDSEDGFVAGPAGPEGGFLGGPAGLTACLPHTSDYLPQDWTISLTELLRLVQFYNAGQYRACPSAATEDGFCIE